MFLNFNYWNRETRVVLFNINRATEWDKVSFYLTNKEKYITNEKVRKIIKNPDTSKVSRISKKWVEQGC